MMSSIKKYADSIPVSLTHFHKGEVFSEYDIGR